jgi:type I restriction enzyme S subunit
MSETQEEIAFYFGCFGDDKIIFDGFMIRGRQTKNVCYCLNYVKHCFKTDTIRKEMIRCSQEAVRANIGQKDLSKVPIIIHPFKDQKKVLVSKKWALDNEIAQQEKVTRGFSM